MFRVGRSFIPSAKGRIFDPSKESRICDIRGPCHLRFSIYDLLLPPLSRQEEASRIENPESL